MPHISAADEDVECSALYSCRRSGRCWPNVMGATKGLRQDKSEENYLRVLLMHLGCGLSMRETVVRARQAKLASLSDVALLKRVRKSREWLFQLCRSLFEERKLRPARHGAQPLRLVDSTEIKEPGQTGSLWRIHYSLQWPSWKCDYFKVTPLEGVGTGEHLQQFPLQPGDQLLADRGYSHASGVHYVSRRKAFITVRFKPHTCLCRIKAQKTFPVLKHLKSIRKTGQTAVWKVLVPWQDQKPIAARLCVIRKSRAAIALAHKRLRRRASKTCSQLQPEDSDLRRICNGADHLACVELFGRSGFAALPVSTGRSSWCSSVLSRSHSSAICQSTIRKAPKLGSMGSSSWPCSPRS